MESTKGHPSANRAAMEGELAQTTARIAELADDKSAEGITERRHLEEIARSLETRAPWADLDADGRVGEAKRLHLQAEEIERQTKDWPKGSHHRRHLQQQANDARVAAVRAEHEQRARAQMEDTRKHFKAQAIRQATEQATREARAAAKAEFEEVSRLAGVSNDPAFRFGDPKTRLPLWQVEKARHEYENATPDPRRVALLVQQIEAEQRQKFDSLT